MSVLTIADVAKSYADLEILQGVTFAIEPGEKIALIGRNGTGKTTILRLLAGLDEPDRGRVSLASWARLAYLPQTPEGPAGATVMAHVLSGAAVVHALESSIHALEHMMAFP
jgi:ATPase subunit of ABC transporter with duplicated ATPase domains